MELKSYQKKAIEDLQSFLARLPGAESVGSAYAEHWRDRGVPVGPGGMQPYNSAIWGVPSVCIKAPTGAGKTFIAASAVRPIFASMTAEAPRAAAWLVPSDAILTQTIAALTDRAHPYRMKLDADFGGRVEVYSKDDLLAGRGFTPEAAAEQLSIFVLSYDSFRTSRRDGRKAYQENGALAGFARMAEASGRMLEDTDPSALIQAVRALRPVVIVDESHHAVSALSRDMLRAFDPSFILELTATPKKESNIISFVDAAQLKREHMVKLPVIVYNRKSRTDLFADALTIRERLEGRARAVAKSGGAYIRPIALFQAAPRTGGEEGTFDKIKTILLASGIPEEQIAIKTAGRDELKGVDLMSQSCPIRFIITVNALKEGWDCPFAYILASVANRNSPVEVEQVLGRVLRQPHAAESGDPLLDLSYVITSSDDFYETLENVVAGLNAAGFSGRECRAERPAEEIPRCASDAGGRIFETPAEEFGPVSETENDCGCDESVSPDEIAERVRKANAGSGELGGSNDGTALQDDGYRPADAAQNAAQEFPDGMRASSPCADNETAESREADEMLRAALEREGEYAKETALTDAEGGTGALDAPAEVKSRMTSFAMSQKFAEETRKLELPQFMLKESAGIFGDGDYVTLAPEHLSEGFTLKDKDTQIDFSSAQAEIGRADIDEGAGQKAERARAWRLTGSDGDFFRNWLAAQPSEKRLSLCRGMIAQRLARIDSVADSELRLYADRIIDGMDEDTLSELERAPLPFAEKIEQKVKTLLAAHAAAQFDRWLDQDRIVCRPNYRLPDTVSPADFTSAISKSLYEAEQDVNGYERRVAFELAALPNIKWWHRNISRTGFAVNAAVRAYPDFMAFTESGRLLLIETKGDHLDNEDSRAKAAAGERWDRVTERRFRYFMVFETKSPGWPGVYSQESFMQLAKEL